MAATCMLNNWEVAYQQFLSLYSSQSGKCYLNQKQSSGPREINLHLHIQPYNAPFYTATVSRYPKKTPLETESLNRMLRVQKL